jgi:hypothetical protein
LLLVAALIASVPNVAAAGDQQDRSVKNYILASQLAAYGQANRDSVALIAAAKILTLNPGISVSLKGSQNLQAKEVMSASRLLDLAVS